MLKTMHPFMASELGKHFSMDGALRNGLLPIVCSAGNASEVLRSYAALYKGRSSDGRPGKEYGELFPLPGSNQLFHASILNITNVARECAVERKSSKAISQFLKIYSSASACLFSPAGPNGKLLLTRNSIFLIPVFFVHCGQRVRLIAPRR